MLSSTFLQECPVTSGNGETGSVVHTDYPAAGDEEENTMLLRELRVEVLATARRMVADGLAYGAQGNISALDPETGLIAITPSAIEYHRMKAEDVVVVDKYGKVVDGQWKPTSETPMHTIFYRERSDVGAVVHTHAPYATTFAVIGEPVPMVLVEAALCLGKPVPVAPYRRPATEDLAQIALETMGEGVGVLLAQHGLITVGANLERAYAATIAAEMSARLAIMARSINVEPVELDLDEVADLHEIYLRHYADITLVVGSRR
nr:class II aldolase/adducin family protein [Anaerolineae bacterium]